MANLIFSNCLPFKPIRFDKRSLVSLKGSPYVRVNKASGLNYKASTYRLDYKFEWYSMRLIRLLIKVEAIDSLISLRGISLFLGDHLRIQKYKFVNAGNAKVFGEFLIYLTTMSFVDPGVLDGGVVQVGFLL